MADNDNDNSDSPVIKIGPHEFKLKYLKKPTWCGICHEFIIGVTQAQQDAYKCISCKLIGHHHCLPQSALRDCAKKKVEFSEVTDAAMKTYLGSSANKAGQSLQRINQYEILGELGRGAFGKVYLVQDSDKAKYAMKSFPQAAKTNTSMRRGPQAVSKTELIHREIAIMKRLNHPNLVFLKEVIEDIGQGNKLYIILEYVDGGMIMTSVENSDPSLSPKFIAPRGVQGKYTEQQASRLFRQVLSGMAYLHGNKIVHRDLKPDNILVTQSGVVKLTDFGVSKDFADAITQSSRNGFVGDTQGTWPFWSPEMCDDDEEYNDENRKYSALAADVWAAGVVLYILLFGKLPFWSDDMVVLFKKISAMKSTCCLEYPVDDVKSPASIQLLEAMLLGDPSKRPTFAECVQYEWIQQHSDADIERDLVEASSLIVSRTHDDDLSNVVTPGEALFISSTVKKKLSSAVSKLAIRNSSNRELLKNAAPAPAADDASSRASNESTPTLSALSDSSRQYYDLNGHLYYQKFLRKMTWCPICNSFVWGLTADQQQAYKCKKCSLTGHIECCKKYEQICPCKDVDVSLLITPRWKKRPSDFDMDFSDRDSVVTDMTASDLTEETLVDANNHEWQPKYLNRPTNCTICHQFIWGLTQKQQKAYKCKKCNIRGHRDCCVRYDELCLENDSSHSSTNTATTITSAPSAVRTTSIEESTAGGGGVGAGGLQKINQYQIVEEFGGGKFSGVYLAEDPSHHFFIVKKNHPLHGISDMEAIHREIVILRRLKHRHIANFIEAIEEINDPRQFYLVLEYVEGSIPIVTLSNPSSSAESPTFYGTKAGNGRYSEKEASKLFRQILSGLAYLHGNGIVHRDVKPENILLDTAGNVKIIGFGTLGTAVISVDRRRTIIPYLPPEISQIGTSLLLQNSMFTNATDVWAAGVVLYILLFGKLPFWSDDMVVLFKKISAMKSTCCLEYPVDDVKSPASIQLLEAMLLGDPSKRPTFAECVQYEWIQQHSDADIERDLVEASSLIVSRAPSGGAVVTPGVKLEKRKSLSTMFKSSVKDMSSHDKTHHNSERLPMNLIDEFIQEVPEDPEDDILIFHGHEWKRKYFNRPSWCTLCSGFITGVTKEMQNSYKCRSCKKYAHAACLSTSEVECEGYIDESKSSTSSNAINNNTLGV